MVKPYLIVYVIGKAITHEVLAIDYGRPLVPAINQLIVLVSRIKPIGVILHNILVFLTLRFVPRVTYTTTAHFQCLYGLLPTSLH